MSVLALIYAEITGVLANCLLRKMGHRWIKGLVFTLSKECWNLLWRICATVALTKLIAGVENMSRLCVWRGGHAMTSPKLSSQSSLSSTQHVRGGLLVQSFSALLRLWWAGLNNKGLEVTVRVLGCFIFFVFDKKIQWKIVHILLQFKIIMKFECTLNGNLLVWRQCWIFRSHYFNLLGHMVLQKS